MKAHDIELMQHADGELERDELLREVGARGKLEAIADLGELVRGHLELEADALPAKRFDALWREIDKAIDREVAPATAVPAQAEVAAATAAEPPRAAAGFWRRVSRWFEQHRGHVITGMVSAGAVAALAIVLRGPAQRATPGVAPVAPVVPQPAAYRPTEIESLDTPGGTGTVFHLKDDDGGSTTVIWVTPEDTVEGI